MSKWGVFAAHHDPQEIHVMPCSEAGDALNEHRCSVECWCEPKRDPYSDEQVFLHQDPECSLN